MKQAIDKIGFSTFITTMLLSFTPVLILLGVLTVIFVIAQQLVAAVIVAGLATYGLISRMTNYFGIVYHKEKKHELD
jgi:hypothetical protein